jgi:uncharacterized protein YndB with AHSA1/START domain
MSFKNFTTGTTTYFGGRFVELKENELIRFTDEFEDPNLPGKMQVTVRLKEVSCGTEVTITQENVPDVIPVEGCYMGWQDSLEQLASLVQPEIPDGPA